MIIVVITETTTSHKRDHHIDIVDAWVSQRNPYRSKVITQAMGLK